ncbi:MAG: OmpH family outer membrane protein [Deltaproteobacteria bacterium]|nr:OmpH family outer membrane protein [Deltaproteobacteria bacterium]
MVNRFVIAFIGLSFALSLVGLSGGCGAPPGPTADPRPGLPTYDKVGVVDVGRVMRETSKGQQIVALLADAERQIQNRLADLRAELETIADDVETAQAAVPRDEARLSALATEYRATAEQAQSIRDLGDQQLSEYRMELTLPLLQEVEEVCEQLGRDEEYGLIVDRTALAFADEAVDLTDRVIAEVGGGSASGALIREALRDGTPEPAPNALELPSTSPSTSPSLNLFELEAPTP